MEFGYEERSSCGLSPVSTPPQASPLPWDTDFPFPRSWRNRDSERRKESSGGLLASPQQAGVPARPRYHVYAARLRGDGTCEGPGQTVLAMVWDRGSRGWNAGERVEEGALCLHGAVWGPFSLVWKLPGVSLELG